MDVPKAEYRMRYSPSFQFASRFCASLPPPDRGAYQCPDVALSAAVVIANIKRQSRLRKMVVGAQAEGSEAPPHAACTMGKRSVSFTKKLLTSDLQTHWLIRQSIHTHTHTHQILQLGVECIITSTQGEYFHTTVNIVY